MSMTHRLGNAFVNLINEILATMVELLRLFNREPKHEPGPELGLEIHRVAPPKDIGFITFVVLGAIMPVVAVFTFLVIIPAEWLWYRLQPLLRPVFKTVFVILLGVYAVMVIVMLGTLLSSPDGPETFGA